MSPNPGSIETAAKAMETVGEKCLVMAEPNAALGAVHEMADQSHVLAQALQSRVGTHLGLGA